MANVKVLRTTGEEKELLEKFPDALRLHIISKDSVSDKEHEFGDFLTNEKHENMYALITKDTPNGKPLPEATRLGILNLFIHLLGEEKKPEVILLNYCDLVSFKAENSFICTLKELMLTYFGEAYTDDITLIIYQYVKDDVTIKL